MRLAHAPWLVGLSILCSGCALVEDASHNTYVALCSVVESHKEVQRNRQWAEAAWQQACSNLAPAQQTEDYALGFKDGYAEYLFRGGDGEPPLIAPLRYRHLRYQNPQGYQAVEDWFTGYRLGAGVAHDTGARKWITGPSALSSELHEIEVEIAGARKIAPPHAEPPETTSVPPPPLPQKAPSVPEAAPIIQDIPRFTVPVPTPVPPDEAKPLPMPPDMSSTNHDELPMRAKITNVNAPSAEPARAKITNVSAPPAEPLRARITTITATPTKE